MYVHLWKGYQIASRFDLRSLKTSTNSTLKPPTYPTPSRSSGIDKATLKSSQSFSHPISSMPFLTPCRVLAQSKMIVNSHPRPPLVQSQIPLVEGRVLKSPGITQSSDQFHPDENRPHQFVFRQTLPHSNSSPHSHSHPSTSAPTPPFPSPTVQSSPSGPQSPSACA